MHINSSCAFHIDCMLRQFEPKSTEFSWNKRLTNERNCSRHVLYICAIADGRRHDGPVPDPSRSSRLLVRGIVHHRKVSPEAVQTKSSEQKSCFRKATQKDKCCELKEEQQKSQPSVVTQVINFKGVPLPAQKRERERDKLVFSGCDFVSPSSNGSRP